MKKFLAIAILAASMSLGACATMTPAQITAVEDTVIADAIAVCGFEPTIATVGALIANAVVPGSAAITSVAAGLANSICAAEIAASKAPATGMRKASGPVMVGNVVIQGHFVK